MACSVEIQKSLLAEKQGLHLEKIASDLPVTYAYGTQISHVAESKTNHDKQNK